MPKPTDWKPARDGKSETRTSHAGNTIHRQVTPGGVIEHINKPDGTNMRVPGKTIDPTHTKKS
jgi:hypothetical protein